MFIPIEVTAWAGLTVHSVFCLCLLVSSFVCLNNLNGREDSSNIIRYQSRDAIYPVLKGSGYVKK